MARKSTKPVEQTVEQVISEGAPMSFKEARDLISQKVPHHLEAFHPLDRNGNPKKTFNYTWRWEATQMTKSALLQLDARVFKAIVLKALEDDIDRYFSYMEKDNPSYNFTHGELIHSVMKLALAEEMTDAAKKRAEGAYYDSLEEVDESPNASHPKFVPTPEQQAKLDKIDKNVKEGVYDKSIGEMRKQMWIDRWVNELAGK